MAGRGWRHLAGFLVLLLCAYQLCLRPALAASPDEESALRALSAAWDGANVLGWNPADDVCTWDHVTCDTNGAVVALNIATANITGTLPGQLLTGLSNLQRLDLTLMPGLGGTIPSELGQLTSLTDLNLQNCNFSGQIPVELSQLANTLSFLALNDNQLTGPIPPELGNLSLVWWFDVSSNQLSEEIPESTASAPGLDSLINAKHLHLNNNSLGGSIPTKICSLPKLIHLLLDSNRLGGPIPAEIGNFTNLVILRLQNNNFNGQIPKEISQITSLQELHLNDNLLTGTLPDFSTLRNLQLLDVSNNRFSSQPFPNALQDFTYLLTLAASNANLTGQLPSFVLGLPTLESLTLSNNALNGSLQFINVGKQLTSVLLDNNRIESITGTVPPDIQFQEFSIQSNPVCTNGQNNYPRDWCSAALARPYLKSTTCGLKTCADTKSLNPSNCACFFVLSIIIQLTSPSFTTIDGVRVQQLERLLAQNTSTQVVVVNATFTQNGRLLVETEFFGVDGRDLEFKIANSIVTSLTNQKIELPGFAPYLVAAPPYPVFPPRSLPGTSHPLGVGAIIGIVAAALAVGLIVAAIAFYALRQKKRAEKAEEMSKPFASWPGGKAGESGGAPKLKGARWFSFSELKKATSNFSDSNEIGVGGYGKVYKGRLESGEEVAIKRAQEGSMQGQTEFKNEIELLSRVHHRNLVGLVGFCYEQGEQMLVYEYMPKGTMRDHLMGKSPAPLHWSKRLSIALGSARGIAYLHELANPPIIHRDIKSSNILLDEKLIAKVADFGLSKLAPDGGGKAHVSTQVKGTLGYLDPEYYMTQQLSDKSDVYSFGVVLLELLTARQPIERGKYIVREVKTALDRGGMSAFRALLDPFLTDYNAHDLKTFLDLALRCVEEAAADRPTMTEVARDLEVLVGHNYPESGQVSINDTGKSNDSVSSHEQEYQMPRPR